MIRKTFAMKGVVCSLILLLVGGCMVGPKYQRPDMVPPQAYTNDNEYVNAQDSIINLEWFNMFGDPVLVQLIQSALTNNYDLKIAMARIEQAEAIYGIARADQLPAIGVSGGASRTDYSNIPSSTAPVNSFTGLASVSWEIDLWGRVRHAKRAAFNDYLASIEGQKAVQSALISDVATLYFQLRDLDNKLEIAQRTTQSRQYSYKILNDQFSKGYVAKLDVLQVEQLMRDAEASIPAFERQRVIVENTLNVLLGQNVTNIPRGLANIDQPEPPVIPSGLPSTLLEQRPDIRYAEYRYMAETEQIGVAVAQRFPTINLTGFLGLASPELSEFLTGDAVTWEVAGGLTAPLFNYGKNKRRVEAQRKQAEIAMFEYKQAYLSALAEVENSLVSCSSLAVETLARQQQADAAKQALELSQARYDNGFVAYLEVLDAQRSLFNSELLASTARQQQLVAYIQLYKALGGGW